MNPHDPNYWALQGDQARAATQGINQMPGVFSNYGAIPSTPNTDINTEEGWLRTNYPGHADLQPGGKYASDNDSRVRKMFFPGTKQIGIGGGRASPLQQMVGGGQDAAGLLGGPAPNTLMGMGLAGLLAQPHLISTGLTGNVNPLTGKPLTPEEGALLNQAAAQLGQQQGGVAVSTAGGGP